MDEKRHGLVKVHFYFLKVNNNDVMRGKKMRGKQNSSNAKTQPSVTGKYRRTNEEIIIINYFNDF